MGGKQQQPRTIVVVGARAAGKTSLVHRLIDEPADFNSYRPTIDDCYNITWKLPGKGCSGLHSALSALYSCAYSLNSCIDYFCSPDNARYHCHNRASYG